MTLPIRIVTIVEGQSEVEALPILLRRFAFEECQPPVALDVPRFVRISRNKLVKAGELERAIALAALKLANGGGVLVLIDADEDCPAELGPALLQRATQVANGRFAVSVVVAKTEFEAWFLSAAVSLRGHRNLNVGLERPFSAEGVHDCKGWLSRHKDGNAIYSEVLDQPAFAAAMDLKAARAGSNSFDKFCRDLTALFATLG